MELQQLIHSLSSENSTLGEVSREIEKDSKYYSYKDEKALKSYLNQKLLHKGMLVGFCELLATYELINLRN